MTDADRTAVTGRRLLRAVALAVAGAITVGVATYFALQPADLATATKSQLVVLLVYAALFAGLSSQFRPIDALPLALRPSGIRDALLAIGIWTSALGGIILTYFCLGFVFGNPHKIAEEITARATDAQRLQGAPSAAWAIAIARACFLVPLFEETFFRGLLLSWLKRHLRFEFAVLIMAVAFTAEHGSIIVAPYVFIFAVAAGWVREKTGSLFNCLLMHTVNNVFLLVVGLPIHGA
jgi:membrane protease YdiL (CAAX protease family)